jgi:glycosyltransferase involved in cell wall biosynthesis
MTDPPVVFLVSHLHPTLGMERAALELARNLGACRAVRIVSLGDDHHQYDGLHVTTLDRRRTGWRRVLSLPALLRYRRTADPRAVYVTVGLWASIPWLLVASTLTRRTLVWEHSLTRERVNATLTLRVLHLLAVLLFPRAAAVVCVSDALAADVKGISPRIRTATIDNGFPAVDEATLESRVRVRPPNGTRLLAAGSLTAVKNQQLALRALAELPQDFTLDIAGDGPHRARLELLARQLQLGDRVRFLGRLEPSEMAARYRDADILLHTSLGETFGFVYFEAADSALPVVSLDHRVARAFIPALVPGTLSADRPTDLAARVLELSAAPPTMDVQLAARARRAAALDPLQIRATWLDLMQQVTRSPLTPLAAEPAP